MQIDLQSINRTNERTNEHWTSLPGVDDVQQASQPEVLLCTGLFLFSLVRFDGGGGGGGVDGELGGVGGVRLIVVCVCVLVCVYDLTVDEEKDFFERHTHNNFRPRTNKSIERYKGEDEAE